MSIKKCITVLSLLFAVVSYLNGEDFYTENRTRIDSNSNIVFDKRITNSPLLISASDNLEETGFVRSFIILHEGVVISENYYGNSKYNHSENIHSASKSMLSALVGIAIQEGYIDSCTQSISDFLPCEYFRGEHSEKKSITIEHLLTMRSGLFWEEDETEYSISDSKNWVKAILSQKQIFTPGVEFNYSTGDTHILAAVVTNASGMPLNEFAEQYLFSDLDITVDYWHKDPKGVYSGGCNLFLSPLEMLRFGQLYLSNGIWNGKQLVPHQWTIDSFQNFYHFYSNSGYGYCWWNSEIDGINVNSAWGYGGQMIHVVPELDLVVVLTTDSDLDQAVDNEDISFYILEKFILPYAKIEGDSVGTTVSSTSPFE